MRKDQAISFPEQLLAAAEFMRPTKQAGAKYERLPRTPGASTLSLVTARTGAETAARITTRTDNRLKEIFAVLHL